jgi:RNA polymerase sigma factor FliA
MAYGLPVADTSGDAEGLLDESALWRRWHGDRDGPARAMLMELYLPYARALAAKAYARRIHNDIEFDDYYHYAVVGMAESLDRYIPGGEAQFKTFATPRIQGAILDGLQVLTERQQQIGLKRRLARDRLESIKDGAATNGRGEQLLQQLGEIGIGIALGFMLEGTGMVAAADQTLPDNAYGELELRELRERLWGLLSELTAREAEVIRRHYRQQQSFDEIAHALKLTNGRISQLHKQALERLRRVMQKAGRIDVAW